MRAAVVKRPFIRCRFKCSKNSLITGDSIDKLVIIYCTFRLLERLCAEVPEEGGRKVWALRGHCSASIDKQKYCVRFIFDRTPNSFLPLWVSYQILYVYTSNESIQINLKCVQVHTNEITVIEASTPCNFHQRIHLWGCIQKMHRLHSENAQAAFRKCRQTNWDKSIYFLLIVQWLLDVHVTLSNRWHSSHAKRRARGTDATTKAVSKPKYETQIIPNGQWWCVYEKWRILWNLYLARIVIFSILLCCQMQTIPNKHCFTRIDTALLLLFVADNNKVLLWCWWWWNVNIIDGCGWLFLLSLMQQEQKCKICSCEPTSVVDKWALCLYFSFFSCRRVVIYFGNVNYGQLLPFFHHRWQ